MSRKLLRDNQTGKPRIYSSSDVHVCVSFVAEFNRLGEEAVVQVC